MANAAQLLWTGFAYRDAPGAAGSAIFIAANYPPLYFAVASAGDPFVSGRIASLAATLVIAVLIARRGGRGAFACAMAWLACVPVIDWGVALKPDLVAVSLTVAGVVLLERRPAVAGALLVLAAVTKPTALVPALALGVYLMTTRRDLVRAFSRGAALAAAPMAVFIAWLGPTDVWRHAIAWNALPWDAGQAALLVAVACITIGAPIALGLIHAGGPARVYLAAALAVVLLGGREGATINYLLDAAAASSLALAAAPLRAVWVPVLLSVQLAIGAIMLDPFGFRGTAGAGHWSRASRVTTLRAEVPQTLTALVEDSGLLVAMDRRPVVDDLFLWSRLVARGAIDPEPLLAQVRAGSFVVVSEVDLARLDDPGVPAYERSRWDPRLVEAVLRFPPPTTRDGLWIYRPRQSP